MEGRKMNVATELGILHTQFYIAYLIWARAHGLVTGILFNSVTIVNFLVLCFPKMLFWDLSKSGPYISYECQECEHPCLKRKKET